MVFENLAGVFEGFFSFFKNLFYIIYILILASLFFIIQYLTIKVYIWMFKSSKIGYSKIKEYLTLNKDRVLKYFD